MGNHLHTLIIDANENITICIHVLSSVLKLAIGPIALVRITTREIHDSKAVLSHGTDSSLYAIYQKMGIYSREGATSL